MEYWSVGVLRQVGIAPRFREIGVAEGALEEGVIRSALNETSNDLAAAPSGRGLNINVYLGLKPQAESFYRFGICPTAPSGTKNFSYR